MAGTADGLFADYGLSVEIMEPAAKADNIKRVSDGSVDFCLTSFQHYLSARRLYGEINARFVAAVVQDSPIGALVRGDADCTEVSDLSGIVLGSSLNSPHLGEVQLGLRRLGMNPASVQEVPGDMYEALGTGVVDGLVGFVDGLPRARRDSGTGLTAVPVGLPVYASGLVAGSHVPIEAVVRVRAAVSETLRRQREERARGTAEMSSRYPYISKAIAEEGWLILEPYVFRGGDRPENMERRRCEDTVEVACEARTLSQFPVEEAFHPQFVAESVRG